jgi:hypothetical protein
MYRNEGLVNEAERFRNGANTHWLTSTLHVYYNCGSLKYRHLFPAGRQDELENTLRDFVARKGVGRQMTKEEVDAVYKKLGWKR